MFVIHEKASTKIIAVNARTSFATAGAAKAAITRAVKNGYLSRDEVAVASVDDYTANIEQFKTVKSLATGQDVSISVNTPISCDPSMETYWAM